MCEILEMLSEKMDETLSEMSQDEAVWPENGDVYFALDVDEKYVYRDTFQGEEYQLEQRDKGYCFKTGDEAENALQALIRLYAV